MQFKKIMLFTFLVFVVFAGVWCWNNSSDRSFKDSKMDSISLKKNEEQLLSLINNKRSEKGVFKLKLSEQLVEACRFHGQKMFEAGSSDHRINNIGPAGRLSLVEYIWGAYGEVVEKSLNGPRLVFQGWDSDQEKAKKIVRADFLEVGLSITDLDKNGFQYYCIIFARPRK